MTFERGLHDPALHAGAPTVHQANLPEACSCAAVTYSSTTDFTSRGWNA